MIELYLVFRVPVKFVTSHLDIYYRQETSFKDRQLIWDNEICILFW